MTKKELVDALEGYPDDQEVHLATPTNNFWKNVAAPALDHVGQVEVMHSPYLNQDQVLSESEAQEEAGNTRWVLILAADRETVNVD